MANIRLVSPVVWSGTPNVPAVRNVNPVLWIRPYSLGRVRQVTGHLWIPEPAVGAVRQIVGHAWVRDRPLPAKVGPSAIWDLLSSASVSGTALSSTQLTLGTVSVDSTKVGFNTRLTLTAKSGSGYAGSGSVRYSRRDINDAFASTVWALGTIASNTTISALLSSINSTYGTFLDPTDIVDGTVLAGASALRLTIASTSYVFIPGTYVDIATPLGTAVPATNLMGFDSKAGVGPKGTTFLFHFNGTNGSTTMTDATGTYTATASGTAAITTTASQFGGAALSLGATTSSVVSIPDATPLRLGVSGDCTLECWVRSTNNAQLGVVFSKENGAGPNYAEFQWNNGSWKVYFDAGAASITVASGMAANTWTHMALMKKAGTWYLFQNGVQIATFVGGTFGNNTSPFRIGNWGNLANQWQGQIDEARLSPYARYATTGFTVPTSQFYVD